MPAVKTQPTGDPGTADMSATGLIALAKRLERERAEKMKQIDDVRVMLRRFDRLGGLTEEQGAWLDTFFPEKEKGQRRSADAIEATRKAREAARKDTGE